MTAARVLQAMFTSYAPLVLAAMLVLVAAVAPSPTAAQSILPIVTCTGSHAATWSPGVTNTTAVHTVDTQTSWSCTQLIAAPLLTSASSQESFDAPFNCNNLFSTTPITWTIHWSDNGGAATSAFTFTATALPISGNLVITAPGTITAGRYAGRSATATFTLLNLGATLAAQCSSPTGVTNASGPSTLLIL
ncbi:hypothetical protein IM816_03985 [Luteibacter flocculans]|uniref:Ig-like domain-containing protein n=1 Tax=Luteibacter flocculans TaxID=2780091 RepID=A0ABY4T975_9GAMM|nr:hypothetical protein [Luteibacter flocculans]URL59281.1 hypothetical protein IM816_03985 [Luteibacter flocculans]